MIQKATKYFSLVLVLTIFACTSGKRAFEKGNYDEGLLKAVNRLRQSPTNKKAKELLRFGYPLTVNWHKDNVTRLKNSNDPFIYERIFQEYNNINCINDEIRKCPACLSEVPTMQSFLKEETEAAQTAAKRRYDFALNLLTEAKNENNKQKAMDAFYSFDVANNYVYGYLDVLNKIDEAKWLATTHVVIEEVLTGSRMLDISAEFFYNKIQDYMAQLNPSPFVRFYSPVEARSYKVENPDQVISLQFDYFNVGQVFIKETQIQRSKDSVIVGTTKDSNGEILNVYGTAKATVTSRYKELKSNGLLDLKVIDFRSGRVLTQEKLPGEFVWFTEWGNFNGDEKALTNEDWKIIRAKEAYPPSPQDLFVAFTQPIYNQTTAKLSNFYAQYR